MKRVSVFVLLFMATVASVAKPGDSLLTPVAFPKTADDLTFRQRMDVLTEGYEPFETVFDSNGICIQNCPYAGFTIADQIKESAESEAESQRLLRENEEYNKRHGGQYESPRPPVYDTPVDDTPVDDTPAIPNDGSDERTCEVFLSENKPGQRGPHGEPLANCPLITSRHGWRTHPVSNTRKYHNGVDLRADMGTNVYATGDGTVMTVAYEADGCGHYIKIKHPNGMMTLYCHLSKTLVRKGDTIQSGCLIGKSGNSGRSTAPHLHYSVRLSDNKSVDPEKGWFTCTHSHKR